MPRPVHTPKNGNTASRYYALALVLLIIDQATKVYFDGNFELYQSVSVLPSVLNFTLAYNEGAAFSLLANQAGWQKWFFVLLGSLVSAFLLYYLRQVPKVARLLSVGLALVLGGAVGNVVDRLLYGHVIDFIHVHYNEVWHYPIFNVADMGIVVGVGLMVIDMLFLEKKRTQV